jgi:hypothetical protein
MSNHGNPATGKQLAYLRSLAQRTGTTFVTPRDRRHASREIERLRSLKRDNGRYFETSAETAPAAMYSTAPHNGETEGFGASVKWRTSRRETRPRTGRPSRDSGPCSTESGERKRPRRLATYKDDRGDERELVAIIVSDGTLVIDRFAAGGYDPLLVGHLHADEPAENQRLLAGLYLDDDGRGRCRPVTDADLTASAEGEVMPVTADVRWGAPLVAGIGVLLQIRRVSDNGAPALRWTITTRGDTGRHVLPLRQVFGMLQAYEPPAAMTRAAIAAHRGRSDVSVSALRVELNRACDSPIVLNRALRERVERAVSTEGLSMSEIATRCGRVKRSQTGSESGETSWLARRIGQLPEAGKDRPTPWVHSDVLALIARDGLGINPCEVEVNHGDQ